MKSLQKKLFIICLGLFMVFILILILYLVTGFTRRINGIWLTPAGINNLLWCFYLTVAWVFQGRFFVLHPLSIFVIVLFCFSFSLGSFPFRIKSAQKNDQSDLRKKATSERLFSFLKFSLILLGISQLVLIPFASYLNFGIPLSFYYQPVNMIIMGLKIRFDPAFVTSTLMNLLTGINFGSFFVIGAFLSVRGILKERISWIVWVNLIVIFYLGLMLVLMFNAKSSMIVIFTMTISGYLAFNECLNTDKNWIRKRLGFLSLSVIAMFMVFIVVISTRYSTGDLEVIRNTLITYGFGHVYCFDNFINLEIDEILWPDGFGIKTFYSLAKMFGYRMVEGVYEDKLVFISGSESNVYTFLRGFIYDFGLVGLPFIVLLASVIIHQVYVKVIRNNSLLSAGVLALVYQFVIYSFIISPLIYMNILVAYVLLLGVIWFFTYSVRQKRLSFLNNVIYGKIFNNLNSVVSS